MIQETGAIEARSAAVAVATASICNAEGARFLKAPEGRVRGMAVGVVPASLWADGPGPWRRLAQRLARLQRASSGSVNRP